MAFKVHRTTALVIHIVLNELPYDLVLERSRQAQSSKDQAQVGDEAKSRPWGRSTKYGGFKVCVLKIVSIVWGHLPYS